MPEQFHQDEIDVIVAYLEANDGNVLKTAQATGVSPRKIKELVATWEQKAREENDSDVSDEDEEETEEPGRFTYKQARFVEAYLGQANGNAAEAARIAGYKDAKNEGYRLKNHPEIRAAIDGRMDALAMSANEVLFRVSEVARGSIAEFGKGIGDRFVLDLGQADRRGKLRLVKKLSYTPAGDPVLELYSSQAAQKLLMQYHGLLSASRDDDLDGLLERLVAEAAAKHEAKTAGPASGGDTPGGSAGSGPDATGTGCD